MLGLDSSGELGISRSSIMKKVPFYQERKSSKLRENLKRGQEGRFLPGCEFLKGESKRIGNHLKRRKKLSAHGEYKGGETEENFRKR